MSTLRSEIRIARGADDVWKVVSDAGEVSSWFPLVKTSELRGEQRALVLQNDASVIEDIVTNDGDLRRFQYRIAGGDIPVGYHLGTVDVLDLNDGTALVVYSTEIEPAELGGVLGPAVAEALESLSSKLVG